MQGCLARAVIVTARCWFWSVLLAGPWLPAGPARAQAIHWVAAWEAAPQGPYPAGYPVAEPDLRGFLPDPAHGAREQTFRMILRPDLWGQRARLHLSNEFGTQPLSLDGVFAALQEQGAAMVPGSGQKVTFHGRRNVTIPPGQAVWSDAVSLPFVHGDGHDLAGRHLAVSFHVAGESGPLTWHAAALTTSYLTQPGAGALGELEDESAFLGSTSSWFVLDGVEMMAPADSRVVVVMGDGLAEGVGATPNVDDRWTDLLGRRLRAMDPHVVVVQAGIAGNRVLGPDTAGPGGVSAGTRLERDVLSVSGVSAVILVAGLEDMGADANAGPDAVLAGLKDLADRIHARIKGVRVVGATLPPVLHSTRPGQGSIEQDLRRRDVNRALRGAAFLDGVVDFDATLADARTGELRADYATDTALGGVADRFDPNRTGQLAMADAVDPRVLVPPPAGKK